MTAVSAMKRRGGDEAQREVLQLLEGDAAVPRVTVIIPVRSVGTYAREAVAAIAQLDVPCEILVVPDSDDGTELSGARIVPSGPGTAPGPKRDLAARLASADILAFLDDDAYPSPQWPAEALHHFVDPSVAAVGGPGVTPPSNDRRQRASGWVLASPFGSGVHTYRFRPGKLRDVDDFPSMNLLVRREAFEMVGGFSSHYWPGEDTELCRKLTNIGQRIVYEPRALVYHHRRPVFKAHLRQQARYGLHRGYFARRFAGNSRRIDYAIPALFTAGLVAGPMLAALSVLWLSIYLVCLSIYSAVLAGTAIWVWRHERDIRVALLTVLGLVTTHIAYGLSYVRGILSPQLVH